jgi:hypothetical protein
LRLLYSTSPSTTGTLSLNNFLKSKYVLIRRHALEIGALRRNRYVPQMGMYLLVRSHCVSWTCTHAVRVQRNQVLHRPNMIEGGHRIHFGIPTMTMGVMKLLTALPPTGIPAWKVSAGYLISTIEQKTWHRDLCVGEWWLTIGIIPSMTFA